MKLLTKKLADLKTATRWDIDFHLPADGITLFDPSLLQRVDAVVDFPKDKRDPTKEPESTFQYIDISAIDVNIGLVANPQDVEGIDAPSRARKVVSAFDILVSTCRPTRGAIAVVPASLHDQIASTGFSVLRPKPGNNPLYLHFALRLASTLEQFRKWSTGSSYPAILDSDVAKTLIPVPTADMQDQIARKVMEGLVERQAAVRAADHKLSTTLSAITCDLSGGKAKQEPIPHEPIELSFLTAKEILDLVSALPPLRTDKNGNGKHDDQLTLDELED